MDFSFSFLAGYVVIEPDYYKVIGSHYLEIRVENLVTVPFNVVHEIPVEYIIEDYAFVADEHYVYTRDDGLLQHHHDARFAVSDKSRL